jgi:NAD(P)H-hydrate epimerase
VEQYGVSGLVLMENAGRGCADVLCQLGIAGPVAICCGAGNNGGDGFVIARHLDLRGEAVKVLLWADPGRLRGDAAENYRIIAQAGPPIVPFGAEHDSEHLAAELADADWIVDALLGTGASGEPRAPLAEVIAQLNAHPGKKMAVDVPSGLDCDTGSPASHTFRADHTCTFVAAKLGFAAAAARVYLGRLHVLDIGAPRRLVEEVLAERS